MLTTLFVSETAEILITVTVMYKKGEGRGLNVQTSFYNRFTMRSSLGDNAYLGVHVYGPILRSSRS